MDCRELPHRELTDVRNNGFYAVKVWNDAVEAIKQDLSKEDCDQVSSAGDWRTLQTDISDMVSNSIMPAATKRSLNKMISFPRTLAALVSTFCFAVSPYKVQFDVMWGLFGLNLQLSKNSSVKLAIMAGWIKRTQNTLELFSRCLKNCDGDIIEAHYPLVEIFESFLQILSESAQHLRQNSSDPDVAQDWGPFKGRINEYLEEMETSTKHFNDMMNYSKISVEVRAKAIPSWHKPIVLPREHCAFPVNTLLRSRNTDFFGRSTELEKINSYLDTRRKTTLCTYTIFGRRGVGKTELALEYVYSNSSKFDAIFWINCETAGTLMTSFAAIADALQLPNTGRAVCQEDNQLAVQNWLQKTTQRWLIIFDSAENDESLKGYWPINASGVILITSRKYFSFVNDVQGHAVTIKPFNERQSWDFFNSLLKSDWGQKDKDGKLNGLDVKKAGILLSRLGGLAFAIQKTAQLVKDGTIRDSTFASVIRLLTGEENSLPARPIHPRSDIENALDSLWNISFSFLSRNAWDFLSILSLLSTDGVTVDLFLPTNQRCLDGKLDFCKQTRNCNSKGEDTALSSVLREPLLLLDAISELEHLQLIKYERRILRVHRVVQEAMSYPSHEIQLYFESAAAVLFEAFPKHLSQDVVSKHWTTCEFYISHAVSLSSKFQAYYHVNEEVSLEGTAELVQLLINCARYLYETSDYRTCAAIIRSGMIACKSVETLQYATLCSIEGWTCYELNDLAGCRKNFQVAFRIQNEHLSKDNIEKSSSLHCMGVLECASGNLDVALRHFTSAATIRIEGGDSASNLVANTYLRMSRVYFNQRDFKNAVALLEKAEVLYSRASNGEAPFMAHVHFAYGNIQFAKGEWTIARDFYPAVHYRIGCVEFKLGHQNSSLEHLKKALSIARLRYPGSNNGTAGRILWKTSMVLKAFQAASDVEISSMREAAETALRDPKNHGEGVPVLTLDGNGDTHEQELEEVYDKLVPEFFR